MKKEELIGKSVIGTLRIFDKEKNLKEIVEIVGQIMSIDATTGILICNHDTQKAIAVPFVLDAFKPAKEGYYELQSGAKVKNPDVICNIAIQQKN